MAFVPVITHMVAEAEHDAASGVAGLSSVISGYRQAEAIRRPFAATASGGDWAFIKKNGAVDLVKIWIALSYACGQRLMVPHPEMQWCHTAELGTHWYRAPADEFSPIYRFVRENARLFDGFVTVGPLAVPRKPPRRYSTQKDRDALAAALLKGNPAPLQAGESVWVFPRAGRSGGFVAHLLNVDYRQEGDWIAPKADLVVEIPAKLAKKKYTRAALHSYDRPAQDLSVETDKKKMVVRVPELRLWSLLEFKN